MGFEEEYNEVMGVEKIKLTNIKGDPGEETFAGISRKKWPDWEGWPSVNRCVRATRRPEEDPDILVKVRSFYYSNFWIRLQCHRILGAGAPDVAGELFEAAVNCGPGRGAMFLQTALNRLNSGAALYPDIKVDGAVGPKTLGALADCLKRRPQSLIVRCQNGEQYMYYVSLSNHEQFPGWFART